MQFCSECHNMYYLKIKDENGVVGDTLIYYCRNCGHEDETLSTTDICVSDMQIQSSEKKFTHIVNEYTKYDPTLPRINTIKCPNEECTSNTSSKAGGAGTSKKPTKKTTKVSSKQNDKNSLEMGDIDDNNDGTDTIIQMPKDNTQEVIYIRYDDINMKYVYLCVHCNTTWRTDNKI